MFRFRTPRTTLLLLVCLLLTAAGTTVTGQQVITIQGQLTDNSDQLLDGTFDLTFRIYELPAPPGSPLWVEAHTGVSVNDGLFSVNLGSSTPLDVSIFDGSPRYLGITVGTDPEISPRTRMGASPYALRAESMPGFTPGPGNEVFGQYSFAAGDSNRIMDDYSSITGGEHNVIEIQNFADTIPDTNLVPGRAMDFDPNQGKPAHAIFTAWIGGGFFNHAHGWFSCATGGLRDSAASAFSTIGCGFFNVTHAPASFAVVGGGFQNHTWGAYSSLGGGQLNMASGAGLTYVGETIGGGVLNKTLDHVATVGGGLRNFADGFASTIAGGYGNVAFSNFSTIGGGQFNNTAAGGSHAQIGGGQSNSASAPYSGIGAGQTNISSASHAYVGGGFNNSIQGDTAFIGGGTNNVATGAASTIGGGSVNNALALYSTVTGGRENVATAYAAAVGGGELNLTGGTHATISGGYLNEALGDTAFVGGGSNNVALGIASTVSGGTFNRAMLSYATVSGGSGNIATADNSTISGGARNLTTGFGGVVSGGNGNTAGPGSNSTVPGGIDNEAIGIQSFAAGSWALANDTCSFVWSDCCIAADGLTHPLVSTGANSWTARATGGFYLLTGCDSAFSTVPGTPGVYVPPGGSAWLAASHSSMKQNIRPVDGEEILDRLSELDINRWSYTAQDESIEHIGPMAEEFYSLFAVGDNDRTISSIDPAGVALAAVKELYKKTKQLEQQGQRIDELEAKLEKLMRMIEDSNK